MSLQRSSGGTNFRGAKDGIAKFKNSGWGQKNSGMLGKFASGKRNTAMGNLVYIHFLQQHYNQSGLKEIENPFEQATFLNDQGAAATLAQDNYKNALLSKFSKKNAAILGLVSKQGSQQLLDSLDKAFGEALSGALNFDRGQAHEIYQGLGSIKDISEKIIPTIRDSVTDLENKFIVPIISIINEMEKGSNNVAFSSFLAEALKNAKKNGGATLGSEELLKNFLEQLNSVSQNFIVINPEYKKGLEHFKNIITKIYNFVQDNSQTDVSDAFKLTDSISKTLQQNLFSKELGELTAVKRDALINVAIDQALTGAKQTQNKHYENNQNTFKTDINIPGKYIKLNIKDSEYQLSVQLQASVKFLKTQAWTLNNGGTLNVESGSGGSLLEFFDAMKYDLDQRYEIYNYLTFVGLSQPFARIMMQRQLFRLFSTGSDSGKGRKADFSTHILANGELISIWELFKFINSQQASELFKNYVNFYLQRNTKQTNTLRSSKNSGKGTIRLNENWMFLNQWYQGDSGKRVRGQAALKRRDPAAAWYRARIVFNDINAAVIHATLHLHKIVQQCVTIKAK